MGVRTTAFVDGLNLYHGLRADGLSKFRWLDIEGMVNSLAGDTGRLDPTERLVADKRPTADAPAVARRPRQHRNLTPQVRTCKRAQTGLLSGT